MCGRYTRFYTWRQLRDLLDLQYPAQLELAPSYNVAPTQLAPIVRVGERGLEAAVARWGLVPSWAKDAKIGARMINARAETVAEKPAFRAAFKRRRCVVPASGFYEWKRADDGSKRPHHFRRADGEILCLAGLWEFWESAESGEVLESFAVIVTEANQTVAPIHDRMPVVLEPEDVPAWLSPETEPDNAKALLRPAAEGVLEVREVSTRVNSPRNDEPSLIEPAEEQGALWGGGGG